MANQVDEVTDRLMKGLEEIAPMRELVRVNDELWDNVQDELGNISSVADFAFVLPGDFAECLECLLDWRAVEKGKVSLLYDMCRAKCGLPLMMANTGGTEAQGSNLVSGVEREPLPSTAPTSEGSKALPTKRARMSMFADSLDDSMFELMAVSEYEGYISRFSASYGRIDGAEVPSREQVSAIRAQVQDGGAPYADFAIFQPHQRRRLRRAKQEPWVLIDLGVPSQVTTTKMPSWEEWKSAFKTFRLTLCILGLSTQAEMDRYQAVVESLAFTYRSHWPEVYLADDTMRAVYIGRYKSGGQDSSWGRAFESAADDINYWTTNVDRVVTRIRAESRPDHGVHAGRPSRGKGSGPRARKDQICFAYQRGDCEDKGCPEGRLHVCLKCREAHELPRGNRECPRSRKSVTKEGGAPPSKRARVESK